MLEQTVDQHLACKIIILMNGGQGWVSHAGCGNIVKPDDRYVTRKFAETSAIGRIGRLRVHFAIQQRRVISTRNFADDEMTARATFLRVPTLEKIMNITSKPISN